MLPTFAESLAQVPNGHLVVTAKLLFLLFLLAMIMFRLPLQPQLDSTTPVDWH